jgi:hypothetical protein
MTSLREERRERVVARLEDTMMLDGDRKLEDGGGTVQ